MKAQRVLSVVFAIIFGGIIAGMFLPVFNSAAVKSPATREGERLGIVWIALREYASDHNGRFPAAFADLSPDYLAPDIRRFRDLRTRQPVDWLYFPGHTTKDAPDTILAAFPVTFQAQPGFWTSKEMRFVSTIDVSEKPLDEATFKQRLRRQTSARR